MNNAYGEYLLVKLQCDLHFRQKRAKCKLTLYKERENKLRARRYVELSYCSRRGDTVSLRSIRINLLMNY